LDASHLPKSLVLLAFSALKKDENSACIFIALRYIYTMTTTYYHGTRASFESFDADLAGQNFAGDFDICGVHLTSSLDEAREYARDAKGGGEPRILAVEVDTDDYGAYNKLVTDVPESGDWFGRSPAGYLDTHAAEIYEQSHLAYVVLRGEYGEQPVEHVVVLDPKDAKIIGEVK
jgi:hypothetical protein